MQDQTLQSRKARRRKAPGDRRVFKARCQDPLRGMPQKQKLKVPQSILQGYTSDD